MGLLRVVRGAVVVTVAALAAVTGAAGGSAAVPHPITQAQSGKTFTLAKGETAVLRLSNRWVWSNPRASTHAVKLTPVEYFVDPGFREWQVDARARGTATIRSIGTPACTDCGLAVRRFRVTIRVG